MLDDARRVPVGAAGAARGRLRRPGSPSRSAATTRARSASCPPCGARRSAGRSTTSSPRSTRSAADGVIEVTLLGQNVNCYGRDLAPGRTASRRAGRSASRPLFAELLRAGRRRRRHPAGPLHQPAPQGPAARDDRGDGRDADGVRAPPPAAAVRQRPGAGRHAPRLHRRALPRAAGRRPGRHRRPRRHHRHHRRLPRRDRRRLRAHARGGGRGRVRQRLHVHLLAPAGHRGGRAGRPSSSPPTSSPSASSACGSSSSARRWRKHEARVGRVEEVARRGPVAQGPRRAHRPHPPEQARPLRRPSRSRPGTYANVRVTGAAPHHLRGELVEVMRAAHAQDPAPRSWSGDRAHRASPTTARSASGLLGRRSWPRSTDPLLRSMAGMTAGRASRPPTPAYLVRGHAGDGRPSRSRCLRGGVGSTAEPVGLGAVRRCRGRPGVGEIKRDVHGPPARRRLRSSRTVLARLEADRRRARLPPPPARDRHAAARGRRRSTSRRAGTRSSPYGPLPRRRRRRGASPRTSPA